MKLLAVSGLLASLAVAGGTWAQDVGYHAKPKSYIVYAAESQTIVAAKSAVLELHFRVQDGFHINSHTPKAEYLLPTTMELDPADGVKTAVLEYPAGTAYTLSFEPNEKLDVYSGAFTVKLPVMAAPGEHKLLGTLHYQACDHAACYPPRTLPVEVLFTAK